MAITPKHLKDLEHSLRAAICANGGSNTDFDHTLLCDPAGNIVIASVSYSSSGVPTTTFYNLNGTLYVGPTPVRCSDTLESDPIEGCASGVTYFQWVVKNNGQPTGTVYYTDTTGVLVPAPIGFTIGACTASPITDHICLCDDNAGILTPFKRFYTYDPNTDIITFTGDWLSDLSAQYTPTGIVGDCATLGTPLNLVPRRTHLTGIQVWSMPASVTSFTVRVRRVGDILNPPTVTDNNAVVTPLYVGDTESYGLPSGNHTILQGTYTISMTDVNDIITIHYLELI